MSPLLIWLALAVIFLLLEIASPAFLFVCFTVGALLAGVSTIFVDSYLVQAVIFAVISVIAIPISRPLANRMSRSKSARESNIDALVGHSAYVEQTIDPDANVGVVRIGSEKWRATATTKIESGKTVIVTKIDGTTATVTEQK